MKMNTGFVCLGGGVQVSGLGYNSGLKCGNIRRDGEQLGYFVKTKSVSRRVARVSGCNQTRSVEMALVSASMAKTSTLIYAVLMGAGGFGAFLKTKSKASIISGSISAILLVYAYTKNSIELALGTAIGLSVVFAIRYTKTKKLMPAGILGCISVVFALLFFAALKRI
uniref:Uncharacterized protein n=1 Tax=Timspurckia oligopyrenoides TaxID=708627 RepID=A0A6T6MC03_9RHOD|mmetsp:Transcript_4209/g.7390  ORF Transcript_4209/g.7390 Transcript_4209/m.7390 type:complete len:168 (+) Transcript_4209:59-562(+)